MKIRKILRALALPGVLGVAVLAGFLWFERGTEVTLPAQTGPFAIGRAVYDWVDDAGVDSLAPTPETKRELLTWIWYPADAKQPGATVDDYIPASVRAPAGRAPDAFIFKMLTRDVSKVHGHSLRNADVSSQQKSYPVVIFRAGGTSEVVNYSTLAEDLASHGYVVVGFDAPYRTGLVVFPDGRVMERRPENNAELFSGAELEKLGEKLLTAWTGDVKFALDRLAQWNAADATGKFTGRLDMTQVGVFGHSFGGATAAQFCSEDSRCKVVIDLDGALHGSVLQTGLQQPFLFLMSGEGDFSTHAEVSQIADDIKSVYGRLPADSRLLVSIQGANHFTFSDDGALRKSAVVRGVLRAIGGLRIDSRRQLAVTAYGVHTFFDAYLKGVGAAPFQLSTSEYPEIQVR
jgi:predicted dienelactone hydrolase